MIRKAFQLLFVLTLCLITDGFAQKKGVQLTLDHAKFKRGDNVLFELYLRVNGNSVEYVDQGGGMTRGSVEVLVKISDKGGTVVADRFTIHSPHVPDTLGLKLDLLTHVSYSLLQGNYDFKIEAVDPNVPKQKPIDADLELDLTFPKGEMSISSIEPVHYFVESKVKDSERDGRKNGYDMAGRTSTFYGDGEDVIKFYAEMYDTDTAMGVGEPFLVNFRLLKDGSYGMLDKFSSFAKYKTSEMISIYKEMDISLLPSGNYHLLVDVRDKTNLPIANASKFFQRSNSSKNLASADEGSDYTGLNIENTFAAEIPEEDLDMYLKSLRPIARQAEKGTIESLTTAEEMNAEMKRKYYYAFWKRRNEVDPSRMFKEYETRMKKAEYNYSTKNFRAYEQDRGRVFLQYGAPNRKETELTDQTRRATEMGKNLPYEIWTYYTTDSFGSEIKQSNTIFVFLQDNLGNPNKRLVHSTALGEVYFPNWKEAAFNQQLRGSPNTQDYLDPSNRTGF